MARALALATRGIALAHPNRIVGAVIVKNGRIIGEGFHNYDRKRPRRNRRAEKSRVKSARRNSLRHTRTLLHHRPHRPMHQSHNRSRHQTRRRSHARPKPSRRRKRLRAKFAALASKSPQTVRDESRPTTQRRLRQMDSHRPALRHPENRAHPRRPNLRARRQHHAGSRAKHRTKPSSNSATKPTRSSPASARFSPTTPA